MRSARASSFHWTGAGGRRSPGCRQGDDQSLPLELFCPASRVGVHVHARKSAHTTRSCPSWPRQSCSFQSAEGSTFQTLKQLCLACAASTQRWERSTPACAQALHSGDVFGFLFVALLQGGEPAMYAPALAPRIAACFPTSDFASPHRNGGASEGKVLGGECFLCQNEIMKL